MHARKRLSFVFAALCTPLGAQLAPPPAPAADPGFPQREAAGPRRLGNVLILVADDLGAEALAAYGLGSDYPPTPNIDGLAAAGLLMRTCWAYPSCSPARASLLTGRHALRTGIGTLVGPTGYALPLAEVTLPEVLDLGRTPVAHAAIGKWHLGNPSVGGNLSPNNAGFGHFAGKLYSFGLLGDYESWTRVVDGVTNAETTYVTTKLVDDALAWLLTAPEPWVCYFAFQNPHVPFHAPPAGLHGQDLAGLDPAVTPRPFFKAMVEALDTELGRLLAGIEGTVEPTTILFLGDNGTTGSVIPDPYRAGHAKGTLYEQGLHVPLIVAGPRVDQPGRSSTALVSLTDVYATVIELAGLRPESFVPPGTSSDSVSFLPYVLDANQPPDLRSAIFAERFAPNGVPPTAPSRAVRNATHKLIDRGSGVQELYDLSVDPRETRELLAAGPLSAADQAQLTALGVELQRVLTAP